nr:lipase 3-like [Onthophagus taurus]
MWYLLIGVFCASLSAGFTLELERDVHPDTGLSVIELIEKYGYPIEQHQNVQTEDGYLLDVHRIPHGKNNANETNKPVVFLMHGVLSSSADWVNLGPERSIAFLLADAGYDVWMGNARGNTWSRKHVDYDPDWQKMSFWSFSWNEIGTYDLPAMIDYILEVTGQEKLFYIGHSQGTTSFFVMASERPEYNDKIILSVQLGPAAFMDNAYNPYLKLLALYEPYLEWWSFYLGMYEFSPSSELNGLIGEIMCRETALWVEMCANVIFLISGYDSDQLERDMLTVFMTNAPAGAATRQSLHYAQLITSGKFRKYDFGMVQNLVQYGSIFPPDYDLSQITSPVALFYAKNDWLVSPIDVGELIPLLPNLVYQHLIPYDKFSHLDFVWAKDVKTLLYDDVLKLMESYL